jgi:hypothetical protein
MAESIRNELPGLSQVGEVTDRAELAPSGPSVLGDEVWEAFVADDDELDPVPEAGDFWIESEA